MRGVLSGLVAGFALVAALRFLRFGKRTGDTFFHLFALAFVLFAANNLVAGATDADDSAAAAYVIRLVAFVIILAAIWKKNRQ